MTYLEYSVLMKVGNKTAIRILGNKRQYTVLCNLCNKTSGIIFTQKDEAISSATINSDRKCGKCGK